MKIQKLPILLKVGAQWLNGGNGKHLYTAVKNLFNLAPENGTNLYKAFESIANLTPPPDNIYLLTDGLPTKGASPGFGNTISAKQRKKALS